MPVFSCLNCRRYRKCSVRRKLGNLVVWCCNWQVDIEKYINDNED